MSEPINENPTVLESWQLPQRQKLEIDESDLAHQEIAASLAAFSVFDSEIPDTGASIDELDSQEVFDLISCISDPEHPLTLGQLAVVGLDRIKIQGQLDENDIGEVSVQITPTITHCSLATLIGLGIRVRLERCLPPKYRIRLQITPGTHQSEHQVNKQLNDKERVAAACENEQLLKVIEGMLATC